MRNRAARLEKLEHSASGKPIQAHAVLEPGEELTPETNVHFWRGSAFNEMPLREFQAKYPSGELVVLRIVYESVPML